MDQWIYPNRLANYREQKLLERENQKRSATPDAKAASPEKPDRIKQESPAATSPLQSDIESPDSLLFVPSNDVDVPKRDEAQVTNEESHQVSISSELPLRASRKPKRSHTSSDRGSVSVQSSPPSPSPQQKAPTPSTDSGFSYSRRPNAALGGTKIPRSCMDPEKPFLTSLKPQIERQPLSNASNSEPQATGSHNESLTTSQNVTATPNSSHPNTIRQVEYPLPDWCRRKFQRAHYDRELQIKLIHLRDTIDKCEKASNDEDRRKHFDTLRVWVHKAERSLVEEVAVAKSGLLNPSFGLQRIFATDCAKIEFPHDVCADAKQVFLKWASMVFDPFILRGIREKKNEQGRWVSTLDKQNYVKNTANAFGELNLVNGQWWPTLLCALRDGAHGATQAGIHGNDKGAYSIIVSRSQYQDKDSGDRLSYCGTHHEIAGDVTRYTRYMMANIQSRNPVRVLRSSNLPKENKFRPSRGFRYDGLYTVLDYEILDPVKSIYQFRLQRSPGQDPIRYEGLAARPTEEEIDEYDKHKAMMKGQI